MTSAKKIQNHLREPFNSISHGAGVILSAVGLYLLLVEAFSHDSLKQVIAYSVFGLSMVLLFSASTSYHTFHVRDETLKLLRKIDRCMIYVLIAGTYTPICLIVLEDTWKWSSIISVWTLALIGILQRTLWEDAPQWFPAAIYIMMSALCVVLLPILISKMPLNFIIWLAAGGLSYILGATVYGLHKPKLIGGWFGTHEIWHLLVLAGTFCHFWAIYRFVTAYATLL